MPDIKESKKSLLIYNRGNRYILLRQGPNGAKRVLPPGAAIEAIDQKEYDQLMMYKDVSDAVQTIPNVAEKIATLEKEKSELLAQIAELKKNQKPSAPAK